MLDFNQFEVISFGCYGTLIDWESGILEAFEPFFSRQNIPIEEGSILEFFSKAEAQSESGPYNEYKDVLRGVVRKTAEVFHLNLSTSEDHFLVESLKNWKPFSDTVEALRTLKKRFRLAILSNTDDALFSITAEHLHIKFDWVITAQQVRSYKPSLNFFRFAIQKIGVPSDKILHVGQSMFHDIVPAKNIGLKTVWVDRRRSKNGPGATPSGYARPDLVVPDLKTLALFANSP
ncbi:MAG TPA: haloacid dehalogenase type II [Nitrospiria bacterium]|jgi:2-haloacid dehalogenase